MNNNIKKHASVTFYTFFSILLLTVLFKCFIVFGYMAAGGDSDSAVAADVFFSIFLLVPMLLSSGATIISSVRGRKFYSAYSLVMLSVVCAMSAAEFIPYIYRFMLVFSSIAAQGAAVGLAVDLIRAIKRRSAVNNVNAVNNVSADGEKVISNTNPQSSGKKR